MYVPLCTVALTDVYKLPSDGGSGFSHINHSHRRAPHFQSSSAALTAFFLLTYWRQRRSFFLFKWKLFSNNSFVSSTQGVTYAVFSFCLSHNHTASLFIPHTSSFIKIPKSPWSACVIFCLFSYGCVGMDILSFFVSSTITSKSEAACCSPSWMSLQVNVYAVGASATGNGNG